MQYDKKLGVSKKLCATYDITNKKGTYPYGSAFYSHSTHVP